MRPILTLDVKGGGVMNKFSSLFSFLVAMLFLFLVTGCSKVSHERAEETPPPEVFKKEKIPEHEKPVLKEKASAKGKWPAGEASPPVVFKKEEVPQKKFYEVPKKEPIYNVVVTPNKSKEPLVLFPGKETSVIFYIGPESEESVTKGLRPHDIIRGHKGKKMDLTVTLNCSLCEKRTYQQDEISYRPEDRASSKAEFKIVPSSAAVSKSQGIGDLLFTVLYRGNIIDRVRVQGFVGDPTFAGLKAYVPPAKIPVETSEIDEGLSPDINIVVGFAGESGKIPIIITPRLESLRKVFVNQFGDKVNVQHGSGSEMAWEFEAGVTKEDVNSIVLQIYKVFRTMNEQNNTILQNEYKRLGSDLTLKRGVGFFSDEDHQKMLDVLKEKGQYLYLRIFSQGEGDLRKAMSFIDNLPTGPPLRVTIQSENVYAPWQILYPAKKDSSDTGKTESSRFWGFRYVLATIHDKDSIQGRQISLIGFPRSNEIAFAGWRGSKPEDDVTDLGRKLAEYINVKTGGAVEPFYERKSFIDKLCANAPDIRFIFAYGHATSGTVIDEKTGRINGVEWLAAHFKFSENDLLTPEHLELLYGKVQLKAQPVVILDACETGTFGISAMNNNGFVGALTRLGAGAVIVTESPVLANFAYHFGMDLINELFDRKVDVSRAVLNVRLKHLRDWKNPLGLVYTLYGNPAARIKDQ